MEVRDAEEINVDELEVWEEEREKKEEERDAE